MKEIQVNFHKNIPPIAELLGKPCIFSFDLRYSKKGKKGEFELAETWDMDNFEDAISVLANTKLDEELPIEIFLDKIQLLDKTNYYSPLT